MLKERKYYSVLDNSLKDLSVVAPSVTRIFTTAMRLGGISNHKIPFITKRKNSESFGIELVNISMILKHELKVASAASVLGEILGLTKRQINLLVTAASIHDGSKLIELQMNGYRELSQQQVVSSFGKTSAQNILKKTLKNLHLLDSHSIDRTVKLLETFSPIEFANYFDPINAWFVEEVYDKANESSKELKKSSLVNLVAADGLGKMATIIDYTLEFTKMVGLPINDNLKELVLAKEIMNSNPIFFSHTKTSKSFGILILALLYCDNITQKDKITSIDERIYEAESRNQYTQLDNQFKEIVGISFFTLNRLTLHAIENVLTALAIKRGAARSGILLKELAHIISKNR